MRSEFIISELRATGAVLMLIGGLTINLISPILAFIGCIIVWRLPGIIVGTWICQSR